MLSENDPLYFIGIIFILLLLFGGFKCTYVWGERDAREDVCKERVISCPVEFKVP